MQSRAHRKVEYCSIVHMYLYMYVLVHVRTIGLTTYETSVLEHLLLAVLLCPEVSKCVNDDTEDEVLNDDKDD